MTDTTPSDPDRRDTTRTEIPTIRDTPNLLGDALSKVSNLVRGELDLFRAEIDENLKRAGVAIGLIVGSVVMALVALNVLAAALIAALVELGIDDGWAALIVGVLIAAVGFAMLSKGISSLKMNSLAPTRTAKNVRRDTDAVKEAL